MLVLCGDDLDREIPRHTYYTHGGCTAEIAAAQWVLRLRAHDFEDCQQAAQQQIHFERGS
jgi:hypothetical protein